MTQNDSSNSLMIEYLYIKQNNFKLHTMKPTFIRILCATIFLFTSYVHADTTPQGDCLPAISFDKVEQTPVIPVGTPIYIKTTEEIKTKSLKGGDTFFVELAKNISQGGKVLVPKGTQVQMEVIYSKSGKKNVFDVTVGGFMINNYLHKVRTENKVLSVDGPTTASTYTIKFTTSDGGSAYLKEGSAIVIPKGTEGVFKLAIPLNVGW